METIAHPGYVRHIRNQPRTVSTGQCALLITSYQARF